MSSTHIGWKTRERSPGCCHRAPCSPFLGISSQAGLAASPSQRSQPPVGEEGKARARSVLTQGRLLLGWVMTAHLTHRGRRSPSKLNGKSQGPSLLHSLFRTSHGRLWGCVRGTSQSQFCLLCLRCGQQTQHGAWKVGQSHLLEPWPSEGPGDGNGRHHTGARASHGVGSRLVFLKLHCIRTPWRAG